MTNKYILLIFKLKSKTKFPVADPKGRQGRPCGPNSFMFMQFWAKILQNNRLAHPFGSWRTPSLGQPVTDANIAKFVYYVKTQLISLLASRFSRFLPYLVHSTQSFVGEIDYSYQIHAGFPV